MPFTDAVPTVVPPLVQLVGGDACGPNTVNVNVPVAELVAPVSDEPIEPAAIAVKLGISRNNVDQAWHRAKLKLRERLEAA